MGCIYGFAVERVLVWFYSLFDEMESVVKSAMFFFVAPVLDMLMNIAISSIYWPIFMISYSIDAR